MRRLKDVMLSPRAKAAVRLALAEDLVSVDEVRSSPKRDATSLALVDAKAEATGEIYAKGSGCVVAGVTVAAAVLKAVDPAIKVKIL
jgi:nicotinate-nucleotide pyrophosphorylase